MVNLGDYVGKLLSEITMARVQADIEAVRVAEIYASDPLLKHLPVPRVRLPKIELDVPVIIKEVEDGNAATRDIVSSAAVRTIASTAVTNGLRKTNISLNRTELLAMNKLVTTAVSDSDSDLEKGVSMTAVSKKVSSNIISTIKKDSRLKLKIKDNNIVSLNKIVEAKIKEELLKLKKEPARIKVSALTSDLKLINDNEKITHFKLSIEEDAVEWSSVEEEDGSVRELLTPE